MRLPHEERPRKLYAPLGLTPPPEAAHFFTTFFQLARHDQSNRRLVMEAAGASGKMNWPERNIESCAPAEGPSLRCGDGKVAMGNPY